MAEGAGWLGQAGQEPFHLRQEQRQGVLFAQLQVVPGPGPLGLDAQSGGGAGVAALQRIDGYKADQRALGKVFPLPVEVEDCLTGIEEAEGKGGEKLNFKKVLKDLAGLGLIQKIASHHALCGGYTWNNRLKVNTIGIHIQAINIDAMDPGK